jgi:hypothetical protein
VRRKHMRLRLFEMGTVRASSVTLGVVAAMLCGACAPHRVPSEHGAAGDDASATAAIGTPPPLGQVATAVVGATRVPCATQRWTLAPSGPVVVPGRVLAVVRCVRVQRRYAGLGTWDVELAEVADSGLGPFVFALAHPPPASSVSAACPANIELEPWFAVISDDGEQLQPGTAAGICGWPDSRDLTLLDDLDFQVVNAVRTEQIASDATSTTSECPLQWQDMAAAVGDTFALDQVFAVSDGKNVAGLGDGSSAVACAYRAGPLVDGMRSGSLLAGAPLPDVTMATVHAGFGTPNSFYQCPRDASTFATLTFQGGNDPGGVAYVELDSCNRAVVTNGGFGITSDALVYQLNTVLHLASPAAPPT